MNNTQNDILEGICLANKNKSINEILEIVKQDTIFKGIEDKVLIKEIKDTIKIYKIKK